MLQVLTLVLLKDFCFPYMVQSPYLGPGEDVHVFQGS